MRGKDCFDRQIVYILNNFCKSVHFTAEVRYCVQWVKCLKGAILHLY